MPRPRPIFTLTQIPRETVQLAVQPMPYLLKGLAPLTYEARPASQGKSLLAIVGISYTVFPNRFVLITILVFLAAPLDLLIFAFVDRFAKQAHAKRHVIACPADRDR